ncbi:HNH endonuclease [Acinetobacter sp. CUI P1]|nr:HNH endonuclease [Acinetobacter sp. CUI P1]
MTFQRDVAKTAARKWFNENNEIITYEKTNCVGNSDYAIFIAGRNHYSPKDKPKESANIKTDEILNFESQLPDTVKNYHGIIARTYTHNETWVKEWCYIVEIPNVHLKKQAEKGGFSINEGGEPQGALYFYFDEEGGRDNKWGINYWHSHTDPSKYFRFDPKDQNTWCIPPVLKDFSFIKDIEIIEQSDLSESEKQRLITARLKTSELRETALLRQKKCRICSIELPQLLVASHIKDWSKCASSNERLDPHNILLLCSMHDALFDKKLITFTNEGYIRYAPILNENTIMLTNIWQKKAMELSLKEATYMAWHEQIFENKWGL